MANEQLRIGASSLTGDEAMLVQLGGPGGGSMFASVNAIRNARDVITTSGSGAATTAMAVGQSSVIWTGTAPTTWAITLPPAPPDGTLVTIGTATTLTTMVTITAATGDTLAAAFSGQTLTAATSVQFVYNAANTTWYRLR